MGFIPLDSAALWATTPEWLWEAKKLQAHFRSSRMAKQFAGLDLEAEVLVMGEDHEAAGREE